MKYLLIILILLGLTMQGQIVDIPDANFKDALVNTDCVDTNGDGEGDSDADLNNDGEIQVSEAEAVIGLFVINKNIYSLEGIQSFINIEFLSCDHNYLSSLDFSFNVNLVSLYCARNQLTFLNLDQCVNLEVLYCVNNDLTDLDITQNLNLTYLNIGQNQFTSIDVSNNLNLEEFQCFQNQLTNLDVSQNINLGYLYCGLNYLTSLDVSQNPNLYSLVCWDNQLTNLDVSNNPELVLLACSSNQISNLDVSQNPSIVNFYCHLNNLFSLDVTQNPNLRKLFCGGNNLSNLHINNGFNENLVSFYAQENPNLFCIQVDDENATIPDCDPYYGEGWCVDPWADLSENCPLGVDDFITSSITIYPNPVQDLIRIENTSTAEITTVSIYDVLGRLVLSQDGNIDQLKVSHLDNGVLFVEIETDQGQIIKKIIKE